MEMHWIGLDCNSFQATHKSLGSSLNNTQTRKKILHYLRTVNGTHVMGARKKLSSSWLIRARAICLMQCICI